MEARVGIEPAYTELQSVLIPECSGTVRTEYALKGSDTGGFGRLGQIMLSD
jgi:hypothetical protein